MLGIYNFVSSRLMGTGPSTQSQVAESDPRFFPLFSSLPPELRQKIWHYALPERLIEASMDIDENGVWGLRCSKSTGKKDLRSLPEFFEVNVESREFCLEQYVPFANTFVHPTLDLLYISWVQNQALSAATPSSKFYPVYNQPLNKFKTVAMTIGRSTKFDRRFGAFTSCLVNLGVPQELLLCLVGPKKPSLYSNTSGFSISTGNHVVLLDWGNKTEKSMSDSVRSYVSSALAEQKEKTPGFKVPELSKRLYYIYSGP